MRLTEPASDLEALRTDIAEELLAINRYEQHTFTLTDEDSRETLRESSTSASSTWPCCWTSCGGSTRSSARSSTADRAPGT